VENLADKDDQHCNKEYKEEQHEFPRIAWRHLTDSLLRRTHDVTGICVHVRYTAAVAVFLHMQSELLGNFRKIERCYWCSLFTS